MKKFLGLLVLAAVIISCQQRNSTTAGEKAPDHTADTTNMTSIQWLDSTYRDLGSVQEGPEVEVAFRFKNTGDKNLVIEDVHASCGCTVPEKPKEPFAPGQEGVIKAKFNSDGHPNINEKTITVLANIKGKKEQ